MDVLTHSYLRTEPGPVLPPPKHARGVLAWMRVNLFSNISSTILTLLAVFAWLNSFLFSSILLELMRCGVHRMVRCAAPIRRGPAGLLSGKNCPFHLWVLSGDRALACQYGYSCRGYIDILAFMAQCAAKIACSGHFLSGFSAFNLHPAARRLGQRLADYWHKFMGRRFYQPDRVAGWHCFSLPLGVMLALGRRSRLPAVKFLSVIFIEFVRGVPFITVLFMAQFLLPLFMPDPSYANSFDHLLRVLIGTALFAAAYMAEEIRGGLQAMPKGQFEGAMALGLSYWKMMRLIILPQALTLVIPGIVNNFIGLFKDTTLVAVVGIFDFLATVDSQIKDPVWAGPYISTTGYVFAAMFYFVFCFGMSRYSLFMERKLAAGRSH